MEGKSIYELELNESTNLTSFQSMGGSATTKVTRVPGGWIYTFQTSAGNSSGVALSKSSCFVPWNTEFSANHDENGRKLGNREK